MVNKFFLLLASEDCPGPILGAVVGKDKSKPVCKVKFSEEANFDQCVTWIVKQFCAWAKRETDQVTVARHDGNREVEIKG